MVNRRGLIDAFTRTTADGDDMTAYHLAGYALELRRLLVEALHHVAPADATPGLVTLVTRLNAADKVRGLHWSYSGKAQTLPKPFRSM